MENRLTYIVSGMNRVACIVYALILSICLLSSMSTQAAQETPKTTIDILLLKDKQYHRDFSKILYDGLKENPSIEPRLISPEEYQDQYQDSRTTPRRFTITIGNKSAQAVLENSPDSDILFTLITRDYYESEIKPHAACQAVDCNAIFIDQPLQRYFALIRAAFPERNKVGLIVSRNEPHYKRAVESSAAKHGIITSIFTIPDVDKLHASLPKILDSTDILLSLPDPVIYNRSTIRNILITTLRHRVPVVGYSESYIKAGATTGIYSTLSQIARHVQEHAIQQINNSQHLALTEYAKYFSVDVNYWVAQSLKIDIPDKEDIERALNTPENGGTQ